MAMVIEQHYDRPMDIEWALDGVDGQIYIVQARPETVKSRQSSQKIERYKLLEYYQLEEVSDKKLVQVRQR